MGKVKYYPLLRHNITILTAVPTVLFTLFLHHVVHFTLNIAPLAIISLIVSTWIGGCWQGMFNVLLLDLAIDYYFEVPPNLPHTLDFKNEDLVRVMVMMVFVLLTNWRKRAQKRLDEQARQRLAVADLGQKALAGAELPFLIEQAVAMIAEHLNVDHSILCELLPDGNTLLVKAGVGWNEDMIGRTAVLADKTSESTGLIRSPGPLVVSDHFKEAALSYEPPVRDQKIVSSLSVAINGKDQPYGVLSALNRKRRKFTPDDIAYLQTIANVLAEAIRRKRGEEEREQLLAREQMARIHAEEANRLKDEFLATVSHELRTPLNHMLGWVTMLRGGRLSDEKSKEALVTIDRNVRAQSRLVEDLLDVSRIVTGRMELYVQPVAPAKIVEAALTSIRPAAEAKGVLIQVVADNGPGTISGDPDRLQQVVWNLVANAIKFTPKGGSVQVQIERVNSHVEITVSDTGEGIAPDFLPYVFDRFSQADGSFKRQHGGLGLGLAVVRHLVELHGGTVRAESAGLGQGSTFVMSLPLTMIHSLPAEISDQATIAPSLFNADGAPRLDGIQVLVVDDEPDARALLITILSSAGAKVREAGGMTEALDALAEWRPDVLVSDIGMPNGDGYDLIRQVRQAEELTNRLPTVAVTAYARVEDRMRALSAGFQMHVPKPIEPQELIVVVASLVGRLNES